VAELLPPAPVLSSNSGGRDKDRKSISSSTGSDADHKEVLRKQKEDQELTKFSEQVRNRPVEELERDVAELSFEIELLETQLRVGLKEYSPKDLQEGYAKIALLRKKLELMKLEFKRKGEHPN